MPRRHDPDYVDRCIDAVSARPQRWAADLTLFATILAAFLLAGAMSDIGARDAAQPGTSGRSGPVASSRHCDDGLADRGGGWGSHPRNRHQQA